MYAALPMPQDNEPVVLLVLDAEDASPVIGVSFWSKKAAISEITNTKGQVRIDRFKGQEQIEIQALGYRKRVVSYQDLRALNDTLYMVPASNGKLISWVIWVLLSPTYTPKSSLFRW